ncbi:hypothetical protein ACFP1I_13760 [Dyadobacter subterraneus]|uniref:SGNH hydrolase-type esterase domain-containing protein n=1 Tax=Dyadobacter subterraneus TaxID=2773304 RepID=A0ABR9W9Z1_9BACT|nr:hypothetical protein [Dyadobacter subterraneus]MBE9462300.1 hypothetical protein [Dyadobacter subterraneus]
MSRKRLLLFKVLAIFFPVIVLVLLECGLRLFGYGLDLGLFVDDPNHPGYLVMNQHTSKKYFAQQQNATIGNYEPFTKKKVAGTFRIFVLGESTTIGYPYMHNGSFHRWLQYRLTHTFPEKEFEIINLSLTAVNSYTVLDFANQVVDYEPDAVLVYTGHNEYYGAMGVGSTSFAGWNPTLIRFIIKTRNLRIIQLATNVLAKIKSSASNEKLDLRENLMKRMVSDQKIALNSEKFEQGIRQFETNMTDLCKVFSNNNVPVFISTLVSNEKDLKPFISESGSNSTSALHQYQLGNESFKQNKFPEAEKYFIAAKELDLLRFRAPQAMNKILRELAAKYPKVKLVNAEKVFRENSAHSILGHETLLEHVHPNLFGYALLSDVFYQSLKKEKLISSDWKNEISFNELRNQMPITPIDSLKAVYEMMMLKEGWPFNEPMPAEIPHEKTIEEQLAGGLSVKQISWDGALSELLKVYLKENNLKGALQINEAFTLEFPLNPTFFVQAGMLSAGLNQNEKSVFYLKKAFALRNDFKTAQTLFITLLKEDKPEEAIVYLNYAAAHNESNFNMTELQNLVGEIINLKQRYQLDSSNIDLSNQIALNYLKFANAKAAEKYINKTLKKDPSNANALLLKDKIKSVSGK